MKIDTHNTILVRCDDISTEGRPYKCKCGRSAIHLMDAGVYVGDILAGLNYFGALNQNTCPICRGLKCDEKAMVEWYSMIQWAPVQLDVPAW